MKLAVFLLVLANLLFYAFTNGLFGGKAASEHLRLEKQLAPERIRILGRSEQPPPKPSKRNGDKSEDAPPPEEFCLSWERLPAADADQLAATLAEKFTGVRVERRGVPSEGNGWWVFMPPLPSKADADKKSAELKELGVKDFFVVPESGGANRLAISLGVFSAEKGAQERLTELKNKGVRSAKAAPRPGKETVFIVEARGPIALGADLQSQALERLPKNPPQNCK